MESNKNIKSPVTNKVAKVPIVMQMEALECGAACLCMIMSYYDKWIPLEQVRQDCGVSRDGSNAKNVLIAARNYGFDAGGYKYEVDSIKEMGKFPCIIHWNFNHFVVLDGFKKNKAVINDPARGVVEVPMDEFDESFTGICLQIEPGENFVPSGEKPSTVEFAAKRLKGAGTAVFFVALTTVVSYFFGVINPVASQVFIDMILTGARSVWLMPFIVMLIIFAMVQLITAWINAIYSLRINGKMAVIGSTSYMWKVLRLPMEFFSQRMAGDIQTRHSTNEAIAQTLVETLAPLLMNTIMMFFYLILMFRYSILISVIGISVCVINIIWSRHISAKRINLTRVAMRDSAKLSGTTVSGIQMIETIKSSGSENGFFENWAGLQASVNDVNVKHHEEEMTLGVIPDFLSTVSNLLVMILGAYLTMKGEFSVGMIVTFQGLLSSFLAPARSIISAGQSIQEMRTSMERVQDVMEYPIDRIIDISEKRTDATPTEDFAKLRGNIEIKNVTFGYSRLGEPIIKDFSMSLYTGKKVAIVGASGCGKSTISKLLSGLYQPWSGEILYDGKTIEEIDRNIFTGSISVVDQDIILFEDTIANNIKMWDESIEDFEMIMAARDAMIYDDIMLRKGGFKYKMLEGGKDFSGGQRQRIEIARVLAGDPSIIILDEATSALDAKTEYEVVRAIKNRGITCVVIAHRLSTIRDCDEIIVLDRGQIVERGTHDELYAKGGYYTDLIVNE
ncbi:MAG: NHLP family bacteriocin export ABC transporter peptidase/permease/ATPase subunit [Butyrivibrio sp.]|nr:NHLP family bacteriocin export ABC transporter peptidase/permease/ATPase subunit [Butyrivibrio sp.]